MSPIRVLVVDDSALMRRLIPQILAADPGIAVVGTAVDGAFALAKIAELSPDVVTLDVDMPQLDGLATLRRIMAGPRTPVVIVSSVAQRGADLTFEALALGAFDFVAKPEGPISPRIAEVGAELVEKVRAAAAQRGRPHRPPPPTARPPAPPAPPREGPPPRRPVEEVVAIGVSTGGPNALSWLLPRIPADLPAGILVTQHMPAGFTAMFAARLDAACAIEVREAREGDLVLPGRALIAPGDRHLKVKRLPLGTIAVLSQAAPVQGHRPAVDVLLRSVAEEFGPAALGLIMTGMGSDGVEGLGELLARGGSTAAQDEATSVVFGMPRGAIERGFAQRVLALEEIPDYLVEHCRERRSHHGIPGGGERGDGVPVPGR